MQQETHGLIPVSEKLIGYMDVKPACTTVMPATMLKEPPGMSGVKVQKPRQKAGGTSRGYREGSAMPSE